MPPTPTSGKSLPTRARTLASTSVDRCISGLPDNPPRSVAVVFESEPIDQRAAGGIAEQARPRIARLRPERHRADFDESEAERREKWHHHRVLVESRGDADRIAKGQSPQLHRRRRSRADA